jgi:hypothetical protein
VAVEMLAIAVGGFVASITILAALIAYIVLKVN